MMMLDNQFDIGDMVYLKTDVDSRPRIVFGFQVYAEGELMYWLRCGTYESAHYGIEITREKPIF